jgi:HSP20 family molecular chaperone IbpA
MALVDWAPAVDVMETDEEFQIRAELPGVEKKDVKWRHKLALTM